MSEPSIERTTAAPRGLDWSKIRAVSLDLDDTLWPIMPAILKAEAALRRWFADNAPHVAANQDGGVRSSLRRTVVAENPRLRHDFSALRRLVITRLLEAAGTPSAVIPAMTDEAFEVFFAARNAVDPFDEVADALARLARRYPVIAITNGNADVGRMALGVHFEATIHARTVGVPKPERAIFDAAAARLELPPAAIVHAGDHLEHDVAGSLNAGFRAVWVDRRENASSTSEGGEAPPGTARVRCLREFADLLGC